jgi:hypothetical protein
MIERRPRSLPIAPRARPGLRHLPLLGNNPLCHRRALEMRKQGKRERLVRVEAPPGLPFDHGRFEIVVEEIGRFDDPPNSASRRGHEFEGRVRLGGARLREHGPFGARAVGHDTGAAAKEGLQQDRGREDQGGG